MSLLIVGVDAHGRLAGGSTSTSDPCLCAQQAPAWQIDRQLTMSERKELAEYACDDCPQCFGTGFEVNRVPTMYLNWANDNAWRIFQLLRLDIGTGFTDFPTMRRAIMGARARFEREAPKVICHVVAGRSYFERDGVVELGLEQLYIHELDTKALKHRLDVLSAFVEDLAKAGAVRIEWS